MRKARHVDDRNYDNEANQLIKDLGVEELYKLYNIVIEQKKKRNSAERDNELSAVQKAIEKRKGIEYTRLKQISHGYRSSMAEDANLGDLVANNNPKRKKA